MQLGRRLEQVLLDKEEAKDEIELLKEQISQMEKMLLSAQAQLKAGADTILSNSPVKIE